MFWSKKLNIHFGFYRFGDNPCHRAAMLAQMNGLVGDQLGIPADSTAEILDLGCGFGATVAQLEGRFPYVKFTGVNQNIAQLAIARQVAPSARFVGADFEEMPFENGSFDGAFALETACFAKGLGKKGFIVEAARVVKPNACFVVADGFLKHPKRLPWLVKKLYRSCTQAWGMVDLPVLPAFKSELADNGFKIIECRDISWNVAPSLMHIPFVVLRLWVSNLGKHQPHALAYIKALSLTFGLSLFKRHFGYYLVTCRKSAEGLGGLEGLEGLI